MNLRGWGRLMVIVGAQYGSEGKGAIVQKIANRYKSHIRVGGPNAGHTIYHEGRKYVMQTVPCGWINPKAHLFIGRGGLVNPSLLLSEIQEIEKHADPNIRRRLWVDPMAGVCDDTFHAVEGGIHGEMHHRIGSTGEGVGAARVARTMRHPDHFKFMKDVAGQYSLEDVVTRDTATMIRGYIEDGVDTLIEGTQGSGLSLIHGPWPYATSADTNAAQLCADVGLPPQWVTDVMLVARTYPIRVAGNSGPLRDEITWAFLSERLGKAVEEKTSVTKKVRRIGKWDDELFMRAVRLNDPTEIALTFLDYINPADADKTDFDSLSVDSKEFVLNVDSLINRVGYKNRATHVRWVGTGPNTVVERWPDV